MEKLWRGKVSLSFELFMKAGGEGLEKERKRKRERKKEESRKGQLRAERKEENILFSIPLGLEKITRHKKTSLSAAAGLAS